MKNEIKLNIEPIYKVEKEVKDQATIVVENDIYGEAAKEVGITKETLKKVENFNQEFLATVVEKTVDDAAERFKKNKNFNVFYYKAPFGVNKSDKAIIRIQREREIKIPGSDKKIKSSDIKVKVINKNSKISKTKIKELKEELYKKISE